MRNLEISIGEHYHIFNRGVHHENIFIDDDDKIRFLFLLLHLQSDETLFHIAKNVTSFKKYSAFIPYQSTVESILSKRNIELINFAIMSNHFHLTLKEVREDGISKYMHRLSTAYSMYFNLKYKKTGHIFDGSFRSVHVSDNTQLLHLSAYIHKNPKEIKEWSRKEWEYPWSSLQDYVTRNRWSNLLVPDIILGQFESKDEYRKFIDSSRAKETRNSIGGNHIFSE